MRFIKHFTMTVMAIAILCLSAVQQANARVPMINEDLTWVYVNDCCSFNNILARCEYTKKFVGTTEVNNHVYHNFKTVSSKFYTYKDHSLIAEFGQEDLSDISELLRDEDDKVWYLHFSGQEFLLYDFSAKNGTPFPGWQGGYGPLYEDPWLKTWVLPDTILGGEQRRKYTFARIYEDSAEMHPCENYLICIEGIGTTRAELCNIYAEILTSASPDYVDKYGGGTQYSVLSAVIDKNGNYIFGKPPVENGIQTIVSDHESAEYYNLQGTKLENPKAGEIVIKVQGGQAEKVVYQE